MTALTRRIALVGCGKAKAPQATEARWLYTGPLFRAGLEAAEAEFGQDVWILSAEYGLLHPNSILAPYDRTLGDLDALQLHAWGRGVIRELDKTYPTPAERTVLTVYAGHAYAQALRPHLPAGWTLEEPMAGRGQGERLAWLKRRLAHASRASSDNTNPLSARPSAAATESPMSSATRLTVEQRTQSFAKSLQLEQDLEELRTLKERFLAAWETRRAELVTQHALHLKAATTGKSPFAPSDAAPTPTTTDQSETASVPYVAQVDLPLGEAAPKQAPAAAPRQAPPAQEAQPAPAPRKRGRPPKARPAETVTGEKRAAAPESARVATEAEAPTPTAPAGDDLVPPPAVPCCSCGGSLSDHDGGTGRCRATHSGVKCRCRAFHLRNVWDWFLAWGERDEQPVFWLIRDAKARSEGHGPFRVEGGTIVRHVLPVDILAAARAGGVWPEGDKDGVPLRVLEVVARVLSAQAPEGQTSTGSDEAPQAQAPSARAKYMAATRERYPQFTEDEVLRHVEHLLLRDGAPMPPFPPEFAELKATPLLDAHLGRRAPGQEYRDELDVSGTESACEKCGTRREPRARLSFSRHHRPRGVKTWRPDKDSRCGAIHFNLWRCARCCTPEALTGERLNRGDKAYDVPTATDEGGATASPEPEAAPQNSAAVAHEEWYVELPARHDGTSIIRLWLTNPTTSERMPCTWWSSTSTLKPGHSLSANPETELLVKEWWQAHQDSVVEPLTDSCRDGGVPGLCLYLEEQVVTGFSRYALFGGVWLEVQEQNGDGSGPWFRFSWPMRRSDMREVMSDFHLLDGKLVHGASHATQWMADNAALLAEAEGFIARCFVYEAKA